MASSLQLQYCLALRVQHESMLVHLKPRKCLKQNEIMENYARTTNWNYRTSSPIHCKKNVKASNLERVLTNQVSANGRSLSPQSPNPETHGNANQAQTLQPRAQRIKQIQSREIKKVSSGRKNTITEVSDLYKKTFKYNTTMYQILKNVVRKSDLKAKAKTDKGPSIDSERTRICTYEFKLSHKEASIEDQADKEGLDYQTKSGLKLRLLESIKKQCMPLEIQEGKLPENAYFTNELKFTEDRQNKSMLKTSLFQWKTTRPHFTKLHWKRESKLKSFLKESLSLSPKSYRNAQALANEAKALDLLAVQENPIDCLFEPIQNYRSNETKRVDPLASEPAPEPQSPKKELRTERAPIVNSEPSYRIVRNKKFSLRVTNIHSELPVDPWHTRERQEEDFHIAM